MQISALNRIKNICIVVKMLILFMVLSSQDINCMPLNPSENMPEVLRRQNIGVDRYCNSLTDIKLDDQPKDWKIKGAPKSGLAENLDMTDGIAHITSNYSMNTLLKQAKVQRLTSFVFIQFKKKEKRKKKKFRCCIPSS